MLCGGLHIAFAKGEMQAIVMLMWAMRVVPLVVRSHRQDGALFFLPPRGLLGLRPRKLPTPVAHFCPVLYPKRAV